MIIVFSNQKGGVGKTTSAICLAHGLTLYGYKVLLIDLDMQFNATRTLCGGGEFEASAVDMFLSDDSVRSLIAEGCLVDVIPSSTLMRTVSVQLSANPDLGYQTRLKSRIENIKDDYDFVIIDTAPGQDLVNMNALVAADKVVIPLSPGTYEIDGIRQMFGMIEKAQAFTPNLSVLGVLVTMSDARTNMAKAAEQRLRDELGDIVFPSVIPMNSKVKEAAGADQSLYHYAPESAGAEAYALFTKEVVQRVQEA